MSDNNHHKPGISPMNKTPDKSNTNVSFDQNSELSFFNEAKRDSTLINHNKRATIDNLILQKTNSKKEGYDRDNSIHSNEKEVKSPYSPSSPMKKMFGAIGSISRGLGLNHIGKGISTIGKGLGLDIIGKQLENISKQGIRGLGNMSKQGLKGLNNLSKVVGLNQLGRGLNNLSKLGIGQLGKGLNNLSKNLNLQKLQEKLKVLAGLHNTDVLTVREKNIQKVKGHLKRSDTLAAIIAVVNSALAYYENDDFYNEKFDLEGNIIKHRNESTVLGNTIRGAIILSTGALLACIYLHYHFRLNILKLKRLRLKNDNIYTAGLVPKLVFELFVCAICCPPYFDYTFTGYVLSGHYEYSFNAIINVITLIKGYLITRLYQHYSPWSNERGVRACKKARCQNGVMFAVKAELKRRPYLMLGVLMLFTIIYLGLAMRTFEISYVANDETRNGNKLDFSFLANDLWLIIITMTTVGFGEGYPSTHMGRFIGVCACIIGMLLVSLMVVSLTLSSEFTPEESKAFYILKRIYDHDNAKDKAANVIKTIFRLRFVILNKDPNNLTQRFVWQTKLKKNLSIFKNDFRIATSHNLPVDEMLKNLQEKLETDINEIKNELKTVPEMENKCKEIKDGQMKINDHLNEILKMQTIIGDYIFSMKNNTINNIKTTTEEVPSNTIN